MTSTKSVNIESPYNENAKEPPTLFKNYEILFLKASLELIYYLKSALIAANNFFSDDRNFLNFKDSKRVNFIRYNFDAFTKGKKEDEINIESLIFMLRQHANFINKYDKEFSRFILEYNESNPNKKAISEIYNLIYSQVDIGSHYSVFLEKIERLDSIELKSKLINRLQLIKKASEEIKALSLCIKDLNKWQVYMQRGNDIGFFINRLNDYFNGFVYEEEQIFISLNSFGDSLLRKNVDNSSEVNHLKNMPGLSNRLQYWIDFLYQDINKETGNWEKNDSTKKFFFNIKHIAKQFEKDYWNRETANLLLDNQSLGEDPFSWIGLLQQEKEAISGQISLRRNKAIEEAMKSLLIIFQNRIIILMTATIKIIDNIKNILLSEKKHIDTVKHIEERIASIEKAVKKLWKGKKKKFKVMKTNLENLSIPIIKSIMQLLENMELIEEAENLRKNYAGLVKYRDYGLRLSKGVNPLNHKSFGSIAMYTLTLKICQDAISNVSNVFEELKKKDKKIESLNLNEAKSLIKEYIYQYKKLIGILALIDLRVVSAQNIANLITKFEAEYYG